MAIGVRSPASPGPGKGTGPNASNSPTEILDSSTLAPTSPFARASILRGTTQPHVIRRDRRGRGMRGRLLPASVPNARSRAQVFDDLILDAVDEIEQRVKRSLSDVEFAVEDVPPPLPVYDTNVLEDGDVPLARLLPDAGTTSAPRIVIYRWPLEARANSRTELAELVEGVVAEQVANLLGIDPDDLTS